MNKAIRATLAMAILAAVSPLTLAWQTHINGTAALGIDDALAIAFDNDRNVVVAGVTEHTFTVDDFTVVKFDGATGAELWRQEINGAANALDRALAVTVDAAGNVIAAGFVVNSGATSDFTVIKFDGANGNELWRQSLNGSSSASDEARAIRVDSADNVIAAGFMSNSGGFRDFTVIKFDGTNGSELWRQSINGTANGADEARDVATDNAGNVMVVGGIQNTTTFTDFATIKLDGATGQELWRRVISGATLNALDSASAIAVDAAGDAVVSGVIQSSFAVVKFDGVTGTELWRQLINDALAEAFAVTLDQNNDVVAAGRLQGLFAVVKLGGAAGEELWRQLLRPGGVRVFGSARDVSLDPAGNVTAAGVTGFQQEPGGVSFLTVVRLDGRDGAELWRQVLNAPSTGNAVAVDSVGNVAAAGGPRDFTVLKLDGLTGQGQWSQIIQGAASAFDESHSVALDPAGNVIAAGFTSNAGSGADFTVVKSDGISGEVLWGQAIDGAANTTDEARSVAVDGAGNVIAAGFLSNTSTGQDFAVMKFDGLSGTERWRHVIDGNGSLNDRALAVTVDAAGNVIAAGHVFNVGSSDDFTVMKLDGVTGSELWRHVVNGTANFPDDARAVTVDSAGNVIAAGFIANIGGGFSDFTVIELDGLSGHELWRQSLNGTSSSFDEANAVTVDGTDNVIAAGMMTNSGSGVDFTTIKFDGASGQELWRQSINGAANIFDEARGVAADSAGNVIAVGSIQNTTTFIDFTVVKFDGVSGQELWRRLITGAPPFISSADRAFAIAVDAAGDAVAAGFINLDFAVVKLDAALGIELWRQVINGTANGFDEARGVALDAAGDVIAAGAIRNTGASVDLSVVKLRGSDGSDFVPLAMLTASPTVVSAGRTVTGSWSRIPSPSGSDWIGLYQPGAANTDFIDWLYVSCSKESDGLARASGSCSFRLPFRFPPGVYELRLLANDGFTTLDISNPFTVRLRETDPPPRPRNRPVATLNSPR